LSREEQASRGTVPRKKGASRGTNQKPNVSYIFVQNRRPPNHISGNFEQIYSSAVLLACGK